MSENDIHEQDKSLEEEDEGLKLAKRLAEEEEGISRRHWSRSGPGQG